MCPSYMATREEKHSTRGRARLLWEMMRGEVMEGGWKNEEVKDALDLCLSCKACKTECPANVRRRRTRPNSSAHYWKGRSGPFRPTRSGKSIAGPGGVARAAARERARPVSADRPALRKACCTSRPAAQPADVCDNRRLGAESASFRDVVATKPRQAAGRRAKSNKNKCYCGRTRSRITSSLRSQRRPTGSCRTRDSTVKVLQRHVCCGRPLYDFGMLDKAKEYLDARRWCAGRRISPRAPRSWYSNPAARAYSGMKP